MAVDTISRQTRLINQQMFDLPHTNEGNIDYRTLGNMISASLLGEVVYANTVDYDHSFDGSIIQQHDSYGWQYYYKESDIVILRKRLPYTKTCCFMGRGVIEAPLQTVVNYIHKFQNRLEWDETILQMEVCQQFSENDWLLYMAHEAKKCFFKSRRDFLYYCRTGYIDGKYVYSCLSIEDKEYPHRPPYIRGEFKTGTGWVIEKYNNSECSTLVTYAAHLDLKDLPPVIVNRVLRRQPMAIKYIRQKLTKPKIGYMVSSSPSDSPRFVPRTSVNSENRFYEEYTSMSEFVPSRDIDLTGNNDKKNDKKKVTIDISSLSSQGSHGSSGTRQRAYTNSLPDLQYRGISPSSIMSEPILTTTPHSLSNSKQTNLPDRLTPATIDHVTVEANIKAQQFPSFSAWTNDETNSEETNGETNGRETNGKETNGKETNGETNGRETNGRETNGKETNGKETNDETNGEAGERVITVAAVVEPTNC